MNDKKITILMIEDNPGDVRLIREMLAEIEGHLVALESRPSLSSGLTTLGEKIFDVLLLDLNLPDSQGLETFIRVFEKAPAIPVVILTGVNDEEIASLAVRKGAQDYLVKGKLDSSSLLRSIQYAIERKRILTELEERNRQMEAFTYSVSHDLKAPLRGIDGYSRLLLEDYHHCLDEEGRMFLKNIRHATDQMGNLIEDLLSYCRTEGRLLAPRQINPKTLIQSLLAEREEEIKSRRIRITVDIPFVAMTADQEGFSQSLRNLLDNAIKYTHEHPAPQIEIGGQEKEKSFLLWVRDNGIGFEMRYHDRIFDLFQRLQKADDYSGTGIGLAIVQKAMQRMKGRVWAESAPGQGATFYLEVPK